jgi:hypothetical protein
MAVRLTSARRLFHPFRLDPDAAQFSPPFAGPPPVKQLYTLRIFSKIRHVPSLPASYLTI